MKWARNRTRPNRLQLKGLTNRPDVSGRKLVPFGRVYRLHEFQIFIAQEKCSLENFVFLPCTRREADLVSTFIINWEP